MAKAKRSLGDSNISNTYLDFSCISLYKGTKNKMEQIVIVRSFKNLDNIKWLWLNHYSATKHKFWVMWYILKICIALIKRGLLHDLSKYSAIEVASFKAWSIAIEGKVYETEGYKKISNSFAKDNEIHYSVNSHHPEYWPNGIDDMSPIDQVEMLCDWKAKSRKGVGVIKSIEYNSTKFNYDNNRQIGYLRDANEAL